MEKEILEYIKYGVWILFGSGLIFEISPIPFNPFSSLLSWFGKKINKDVKEELTKLQSDIKTVQLDLQDHKVESWRRDILDFANSIMLGKKRTKEDFDNIINLHTKYEKYIIERKLCNGQVDLAFEYISNTYYDCIKTNDFYSGR